jgi:hypothetical protein
MHLIITFGEMIAMKKVCLVALVMLGTIAMVHAQQKNQHMLRHVVMFGWKEGTDTAQINKVVTAFKALSGKIPLIKAFEWGTNNSPEKLNQGLTHCFFLSFSSEKDRDAYLIHPDHKAFVASLVPAPEHVTVFDYWTE